MGRIVGIDLGTTNSCIAVRERGEIRVLANELGAHTTPSVIALAEQGLLVGAAARRQAVLRPHSTLFGVKRLIGRRFDSPEVQAMRRAVPYEVVAAGNGDAWLRVGDRVMSPPEVSALILRHLKSLAEQQLGEAVTQAVITVPAYFDDAQRQATKDAGRIAGLDVRTILNEPTAAALAYGVQRANVPATVAVFDLGGGTFDISILRVEDGVFEVLATSGDTFLGGADFDQLIVNHLAGHLLRETGFDPHQDPAALQRLREAAESAKHELSSLPATQVSLPFLANGSGGPIHLEKELKRSLFEELSRPLLERLDGPCLRALEDARLSPGDLEQVVLVGGMTRMPAVQERVVKIFGKRPLKGLNPDEIVAVGAAMQSAIMSGEVREVVLLDVASHSLGIRVAGDKFAPIIRRNVTIPVREAKVFATTEDDQDFVALEIYQGEGALVSENRYLGQFVLGDLPRAPAGEVQVQVSFLLDADGILQVDATETRSGRATSKKILASSGLSREEVDRLAAEHGQVSGGALGPA